MEHLIKELIVKDDLVSTVKFMWGLEERPLWAALKNLGPQEKIKWVDRVNPYESCAAEWSLALAYENLLKIKVPLRGEYIRALLAELQRILWGFNVLATVFKSIEDQVRFEQALRLREYIFQGQEIFTGSRILPQAFVIGGVERDFSVGEIRKFKDLLKNIEFELRMFFRDLLDDILFTHRLRTVLPLPKETLSALSWYGPVGQASGLVQDLRVKAPYGIYESLTIKHFTPGAEGASHDDALARVQSVLFQIRQSVNACYHMLVAFPEGEFRTKVDLGKASVADATATVEGASGPVTAIISKGEVRVTTTSMRIAPWLSKICEGIHCEDLELAISSLGFSFEEADLR